MGKNFLLNATTFNIDDIRPPQTTNALILKLKNRFKWKPSSNKTLIQKKFTKLIKYNGYYRVRSVFLYLEQNFDSPIKTADVVLTFKWERKFRAFLKGLIEEIEIAFSNSLLMVITNPEAKWNRKFPNIDEGDFFIPQDRKRILNLFKELRSRFWNHKDDEIDNKNLTKGQIFKIDDVYIWDCFQKATFGDLITFYTSLKEKYQNQVILNFCDHNLNIHNTLREEFIESIRFLKIIRNKIYHNEQLFANGITNHLTRFYKKIKYKKLTPIDKVVDALIYILPAHFTESLQNWEKYTLKKSKKYKYVTTFQGQDYLRYNIWNEKLNK